MKIWVKLIKDDKIKRDGVCERQGKDSLRLLETCVRDVAEQMDMPCPILLKTHFSHFVKFNMTKLLPRDFVETVDFDHLIIENIAE